jgi:predicted tellurium resistance membrane protein TerC
MFGLEGFWLLFMDFSYLATPEALISLLTLTFLEIVLGVDNIVFISITTDRLPKAKQHIGRKLGLAGALVSRCIFLCFASWLVSLTVPLFTLELGIYAHSFTFRDIVMLAGGAYLLYKGVAEIIDMLNLTEVKAEESEEHKQQRTLTLPGAVATIMVMDVVFSIDSVITAVGLAQHLLIMIAAVVIAIIIMMVFIDQISDFINKNVEMKILALVFISAIGVLLVLDSCGITTGIELLDMHLEKLMVYFAMVFAILLELVQMKYNSNLRSYLAEKAKRTKSSAASIKADDASDTFAIDKQNAECVTGDKTEGTER